MVNFRVLVDFIRDDQDGMARVPSLSDAQTVLRMLHSGGMEAGALLRRCNHFEWGLSLVCTTMVCFHQTQRWSEFVCELVRLPVGFWEETEIRVGDLMQAFGGAPRPCRGKLGARGAQPLAEARQAHRHARGSPALRAHQPDR